MIQYLSHILSNDLTCYNNEKNISITPYKNNEVSVILRGHCGTHIDFPFHVDKEGRKAQDYSVNDLRFIHCFVKQITAIQDYIQPEDIKGIPEDVDFLIFKTQQGDKKRYTDDYVINTIGISERSAVYLRGTFTNLRCVGIDSISINAYQDKNPGRLAHREFLCKKPEILIIEDMNLTGIEEGLLTTVIVAPLLIENADGVPVTVLAKV